MVERQTVNLIGCQFDSGISDRCRLLAALERLLACGSIPLPGEGIASPVSAVGKAARASARRPAVEQQAVAGL